MAAQQPQKLTVRTVTDLPALCAQLNEVRACGYAIDDEETSWHRRGAGHTRPRRQGGQRVLYQRPCPLHDAGAHPAHCCLALETRADILRDLGVQGV